MKHELARPLSFADARALFPALKERVWLNAAASSPASSLVLEAMQKHLQETVNSGDLHFPAWLHFKEQLRARVAAFIGASAAKDVGFTPSTSFGFHVIAQCLKARGIDEVLVLESEFPSTTVPLLNAGLTLRGVRRRADGSAPVEDYEAALRPSTKAVAVSVVQFNSGYRIELEALAQLCRERGLALILNASQALGQVPIDVTALGASFMASASHKWLGAGQTLGLLYVRPDWLEGGLPMAGWLSVRPETMWRTLPGDTRIDDHHGFVARGVTTRHDASALELGPTPWVVLYGLNAALELLESLRPASILEHNLRLQRLLRAGLRQRGFAPNAPDESAEGSGICVVPVEGDESAAVRALLREASIMTTPRGGGVRISTHFYNDEDDVLKLFSAIERLGILPASISRGNAG